MRQFKVRYFEDVVTEVVHDELVSAKSFIKDGNMIIFYDYCDDNIAAFSNVVRVKEAEKNRRNNV